MKAQEKRPSRMRGLPNVPSSGEDFTSSAFEPGGCVGLDTDKQTKYVSSCYFFKMILLNMYILSVNVFIIFVPYGM